MKSFHNKDAHHRKWMTGCIMKQLVCLIVIVLLTFHRSYPKDRGSCDSTGSAETICITNVFAVDIEYPNFLVSILAHLAGVHTDSLKFVEWDIRTPVLSSFLLHLTDDERHRWFEIASDSAFPSFVKLPLEDRTILAPSALNFFKQALEFFRNTRTDTLHATFEYNQDTLGASVFHLPGRNDTGSHITTFSHIETWNKRTGEQYNNAEVTAVTQDGYTIFQNVTIFLKKKKITLRLASARVTVVRSKY